jgi:hypothetical protein
VKQLRANSFQLSVFSNKARFLKLLTVSCLLLAVPARASGQALETQAGGGTLFAGEGGSMKLYLPSGVESRIAGGLDNGHVVYGANLLIPVRQAKIALGDDQILFPLPTDFSQGNYGFYVRGGSIRHTTKAESLTVFGGWVSTEYMLPTFMGLKPTAPTGLIFYRRALSEKWTLESHEVFASRQTAIQSLAYTPWPALSLSASGGIGSNSPFAAGALHLNTRRLNFRSSYSSENAQFRRIQSPLYVIVENNHGNAHLDFRPFKPFALHAEHINLLSPLANGSSAEAQEDTVGGALTHGVFHAGADAFWSKSRQIPSRGESYSAGIRLFSNTLILNQAVSTTPLTGSIFSTAIQENIRPEFGLSQFINHSNGATSLNFGGNYTGSRFSFNLGWSEQFLPFSTAAPFQKVLTVQVSLRLPHDSSLQVQTLTDSMGHARFALIGQNDLYGEKTTQAGGAQEPSFGKWVVRGRVVDERGEPVEGAALQIGKETVFTDRDGNFLLRFSKPRRVPILIVPAEFAAPGRWHAVQAPETAMPEPENQATPLHLEVGRGGE